MCGIAGIILNPNSNISDLQARLLAMQEAMLHRGPDDAGVYLSPDGRVGLVNRRLAIRDVSPAGHMPMTNAAQTVWITYNGELYNAEDIRPELERLEYHFVSSSDTEVILHGYEAWGERVVEKMRGIFALAILDLRETPARLFLARDQLGVKPLYFASGQGAFVFASELKGLMASGLVGQALSPAGLVGYLLMGSVPNPLTIYQDVQALEPGCSLTLRLDERLRLPAPQRYWSLPTDTLETISAAEAVEQVRALLEESVRRQLVSDVPLGAFLSGGLDSGAVVALMRRATNGSIRTCSMVFEEAAYSEAPYAKAMAEAVGADHFERVITAKDVTDQLDAILAAMDQPTIDGINTYFVSQTARQAGLTVALSGLGGDELFGGYRSTFQGVPQMLEILKLFQVIPGGRQFARVLAGAWPDQQRLARVSDMLNRPATLASAYLTRRGLFSMGEVRALVGPEVWQTALQHFEPLAHVAQRADAGGGGNGSSAFAWVSRAELSTYTHHQLLRDTDVMSMAHSLEVRVPLLDHKLVDFVVRLPDSIKQAGAGPKPLLVRAIGDLLPESIRTRPDKQGFEFPLAKWLHGQLGEKARRTLPSTPNNGWLRREAVAAIWQDFDAGKRHWSRPWALAALNGWNAVTQGA